MGYKVYFLLVQLNMKGTLSLILTLMLLKRLYIAPENMSLSCWCCCTPTCPVVMHESETFQGADPAERVYLPFWHPVLLNLR